MGRTARKSDHTSFTTRSTGRQQQHRQTTAMIANSTDRQTTQHISVCVCIIVGSYIMEKYKQQMFLISLFLNIKILNENMAKIRYLFFCVHEYLCVHAMSAQSSSFSRVCYSIYLPSKSQQAIYVYVLALLSALSR